MSALDEWERRAFDYLTHPDSRMCLVRSALDGREVAVICRAIAVEDGSTDVVPLALLLDSETAGRLFDPVNLMEEKNDEQQ